MKGNIFSTIAGEFLIRKLDRLDQLNITGYFVNGAIDLVVGGPLGRLVRSEERAGLTEFSHNLTDSSVLMEKPLRSRYGPIGVPFYYR